MTHHFGQRLHVDGRDKPWLRQSKSSKTSAGSVAGVFFWTNMEVSGWEKIWKINGDCRRVAQQKRWTQNIEKHQTYQDSDKVL